MWVLKIETEEKATSKAPIQKKTTLLWTDTDMNREDMDEALSILEDIGREIKRQGKTPEFIFKIRPSDRYISFTEVR